MKTIPRIRSKTVRARMAIRRRFTSALAKVSATAVAQLDIAEKAALSSQQSKRIKSLVFGIFEDEAVSDGVIDTLTMVATDGVSLALAQIKETSDVVLDQANEEAISWAKVHGAELVTSVSDTTKDALADLISKAEEEGWSNAQLAQEIEGSFWFSRSRADVIARTETARADVQGNITAYKASTFVDRLKWITAKDDKVSDECQMNDGEIREFGQRFPSGVTEPPGHPNCRCDVVPVFRKDDDEED